MRDIFRLKRPFRTFTTTSLFLLGATLRADHDLLRNRSFFASFLMFFFAQYVLYMTWSSIIYPKLFHPVLRIPAVKGGNFLMGHLFRILREPSGNPHIEWLQDMPHEPVIRYSFAFNAPRVMPVSPRAISEVLVQKNYDFPKPGFIKAALAEVLGNGILIAEGDDHKIQRKHLMPAFSYRHIKDLYPLFWRKSLELNAVVSEAIQNQSSRTSGESVVDIEDCVIRATLDIIGAAGCGHNFDALHNPDNELVKAYSKVITPSKTARILRFMRQILLPVWLASQLPTRRSLDLGAAIDTIKSVSMDLIQKKKEKIARGDRSDVDIISVALESGSFTDEQLMNQLMTFLAAGHETTASSVVWTLYYLCKRKDIQKRLRDEIHASLPSGQDGVTATSFEQMTYLNAVLSESLRLSPAVPFTIRQARKDTSIEGYEVPKGTTVVVVPWAINCNKELWGEDAYEFIPERWIGPGKTNSGGAPSNFAFSTFLHGPRSCIGQAFAKAELACIVSALVGRFEFDFPAGGYDLRWGGEVTVRPRDMKLKMTPVGGWSKLDT